MQGLRSTLWAIGVRVGTPPQSRHPSADHKLSENHHHQAVYSPPAPEALIYSPTYTRSSFPSDTHRRVAKASGKAGRENTAYAHLHGASSRLALSSGSRSPACIAFPRCQFSLSYFLLRLRKAGPQHDVDRAMYHVPRAPKCKCSRRARYCSGPGLRGGSAFVTRGRRACSML